MSRVRTRSPSGAPRLALALGGGAARGLAHLGVLEVLEREGLRPAFIAGTSMGGLVGALYACGLGPHAIADLAREFRFPAWFVPGGTVAWRTIFPSAVGVLSELTFADLVVPLALAAVDIEEGRQVVLSDGPVLSAVEATCAIPGVLPPVRRCGRWLVDGAVVNVLPVDVACMADPDAIVAVSVGTCQVERMPRLEWTVWKWVSRLGRLFPNPATARVAFEVLVRSSEIALDRTTSLTLAMAEPEILVEVDVRGIGLRDFHRVDEAVAAGRRAAEAAMPALRAVAAGDGAARWARDAAVHVDPVCRMVVSARRARGRVERGGTTVYFCSENCRHAFERDPERYRSHEAHAAAPKPGR